MKANARPETVECDGGNRRNQRKKYQHLATVQTAAAASISQQPFDWVTLGSFSSADFVERAVTEINS